MAMDAALKYLDFLQAAIARMGGHSFAIKGWCITVSTAILAAGTKDGNESFFAVGLLPVLLFWGLDSYFLTLERGFRSLFRAAAAAQDSRPVAFEMSPGAATPGQVIATMARPALVAVHGTLFVTLLGAWLLVSL